jgi:opacity protein-like surface antigen
MNRIIFALLSVGVVASAADAAPSRLSRDDYGGYKVTYDYTDKEKSGWYGVIRAQVNFLNFDYKYSSNDVAGTGTDKYSLKPVIGGSVAVGKKFAHVWRGELEVGYSGLFSDGDDFYGRELELRFSTPYLMANAYYDFSNGLYLGAGLGAALPVVTLDWERFVPRGSQSKAAVSPMGGLMAGISRKLDDNLAVDFRYRLAGWNGTRHDRQYQIIDNNTGVVTGPFLFKSKIGLVLENSISVGLRYEF